jgi:diguanylate cyclase (GGDEF)-like protein/PAS domain S-box-containing protein
MMDSIRTEMDRFVRIEQDALAQRDAEFHSTMRHLFASIVSASLLTLLFALSFAYLIYRETQHRLKNLVHLETRRLLEVQEATNQQLQQSNIALHVSEEKLAVTLHSIGDAVIATDAEGRVTLLNPLAEQLTGWKLAQAAGRPVEEIFHIVSEETRQPSTIPIRETLAQGTTQGLANHTVLIALDGSERAIADSCAPIRDRDARVVGAVLVFRDVTKEYAAQQALRDSAAKLRLFADNVPAMTASWDENLSCSFANKLFTEYFSLGVEDVIGKHMRELFGEEVYREIEGQYARALQGYPVNFQRTHKLPDGELRYLEIKLLPHIGDQGKVLGCFAVTTDVTEHKLAEERIQHVADHDSLTGLPNRLLFNDRLEQAISHAKRDSRQFALLYLDLDKFKPVNDTLGHTAGDELLKAVAARIRSQVRESDTVARVGGDEFTVILPDIARREEAEAVARKIVAALAMPFQLGSQKQSVDIGTSIGIALYPTDARNADALVDAADAAMYRAKQAGSTFRLCAA